LKRALDIAGAACGLTLLAPVLGGAALAVRLSMGRPVLFRQVRQGLHGRPFELRKLRTMRAPRPGEEGPEHDTARLTRVGAFLRATSLDELPTLINVLEGTMSLVGPRPLLLRYIPRYSPRQATRMQVKPGITGLSQVMGRNALAWEEKLELDAEYVERQSLWLDLAILARTVKTVLLREGISQEGHATMPEFEGSPSPRRGNGAFA
jgi:sugar transferase EpsL